MKRSREEEQQEETGKVRGMELLASVLYARGGEQLVGNSSHLSSFLTLFVFCKSTCTHDTITHSLVSIPHSLVSIHTREFTLVTIPHSLFSVHT